MEKKMIQRKLSIEIPKSPQADKKLPITPKESKINIFIRKKVYNDSNKYLPKKKSPLNNTPISSGMDSPINNTSSDADSQLSNSPKNNTPKNKIRFIKSKRKSKSLTPPMKRKYKYRRSPLRRYLPYSPEYNRRTPKNYRLNRFKIIAPKSPFRNLYKNILKNVIKKKKERDSKCFLIYFSLLKYISFVKCESLKSLFLLYKKNKKFENEKLKIFFTCGWDKLYNKIEDKSKLLNIFDKTYKILKNKKSNLRAREEDDEDSDNLVEEDIFKKCKYRKKIWISFGVNEYLYWSKLNNAVNDANSTVKFSKEKLGFDVAYSILDKDFSKQKIERELKGKIYEKYKERDLIVISFHCHGHVIKVDNEDHGFVVPFDAPKNPTPADLISMEDLTSWSKYVKCRHVLIILDCCFSGLSIMRSNENLNESYNIDAINKLLEQKCRIVINSGIDKEKVNDSGWNNNSVFTGALMSYVGFYNNIGSVHNLFNYLVQTIPKKFPQTPSMGFLVGHKGGDMFLNL
jgi:hypothetical protein